MKIISRATMTAVGLAAGLALVPGGAFANHDRDNCKSDIEAEATVHGTGPGAAHEAKSAAVAAWKHAVAAKHGWAYARWSRAGDKDLRCDTHKRKGTTECEAEADPCH